MISKQNYIKSIMLVAWMVVLSAFTVVLGAVPMRTLRIAAGRMPFVLFQSGLIVLFWAASLKPLALTILALSVLTLVYCELEQRKLNYFWSGIYSVVAGLVSLSVVFSLWATRAGATWSTVLREKATSLLGELKASGVTVSEALTVDELLIQVPSVVMITLALALFFSLAMEERALRWIGIARSSKRNLLEFRVPEYFIWIFILSLAGSFLKINNEVLRALSLNIFNLSLIVFFFQGLAVIYYFFRTYRVGFFGRVLSIVLIFGQPLGMMGVSIIGVADYWLEFRRRFKKSSVSVNKEFR